MFIHHHPYPPLIPEKATKLIVGTIPPPRFSGPHLYQDDVDFCYGSKHGLLWPILDTIYDLNLIYLHNEKAVEQRKKFLTDFGIGICDIIESCEREKNDASDLGMSQIKLRDLIGYLKAFPRIDTLLFMGGLSKNGPENLFRRHLSTYGLKLQALSLDSPRMHQLTLDDRRIKTISLISPSNAANRSIGADPKYKKAKQINKDFSTLQFRIDQYRKFFI